MRTSGLQDGVELLAVRTPREGEFIISLSGDILQWSLSGAACIVPIVEPQEGYEFVSLNGVYVARKLKPKKKFLVVEHELPDGASDWKGLIFSPNKPWSFEGAPVPFRIEEREV